MTDAGSTATYTWNARNQLTGISATGFSASFTYDSFGRRTGRTVQGVVTNYVYDGLNPVQEKNGATVTANLLTGLGIDEFFTRTDGVGSRTLLPDALGSTVALGDSTGTLQTQYTYEPFGYATQTGLASSSSYKYTGREDDGSGLDYYRARYYHPRLQRFIGEDPIGFGGGDFNLYGYVSNNTMKFADPLGLYNIDPNIPKPSPQIDSLLTCIEKCLGTSFTVTSTFRPGAAGPHGIDQAADIRYRGPGTTSFTSSNFMCCAGRCGAGFGLDEFQNPSPGATGSHLHIQIPPGRSGGSGDIPASCGSSNPGCSPARVP